METPAASGLYMHNARSSLQGSLVALAFANRAGHENLMFHSTWTSEGHKIMAYITCILGLSIKEILLSTLEVQVVPQNPKKASLPSSLQEQISRGAPEAPTARCLGLAPQMDSRLREATYVGRHSFQLHLDLQITQNNNGLHTQDRGSIGYFGSPGREWLGLEESQVSQNCHLNCEGDVWAAQRQRESNGGGPVSSRRKPLANPKQVEPFTMQMSLVLRGSGHADSVPGSA